MLKNLLLYSIMLLMIMFFAVASILGVYTLGITLKYLFELWSQNILYQSTINDVVALTILTLTFITLLIYWVLRLAYKLFKI